jgi:hypothetical protein
MVADCHFNRVQRGVTEDAWWDCRGRRAAHRSNAPSPFIASGQMTAHWPTIFQVSPTVMHLVSAEANFRSGDKDASLFS